MRLLLLIFYLLFVYSLFSQEDLEKEQAGILYKIAQSYYQDGFYSVTIENLMDYLFLYPNGERKNEVYSLLEKSYEITKNYDNLQKLYLVQYTNSPFSDEGILAYFKLGKLYIKIGEIEKGKEIFQDLNQTQFSFLIRQKIKDELEKLK